MFEIWMVHLDGVSQLADKGLYFDLGDGYVMLTL